MTNSNLFLLSLFFISLTLVSSFSKKDAFASVFKSQILDESLDCTDFLGTPPSGCIWLYRDYNTKVEVCSSNPDLRGISWDNYALAVRVGPNTAATLWDGYTYTGDKRVYSTAGYYQFPDFFCATSSVQVVNTAVQTIRGYLKSALDNTVLSATILSNAISISFVDSSGKSYQATVTASTGIYSVQLPPGTYQRNASLSGYISSTTSITVTTSSDETNNSNTILFAPVFQGWRAVFTWGAIDPDMDSYTKTPSGEIIYYRKKASTDLAVQLDIDSRNMGPETMSYTFNAASIGTYSYYVQSYTKKAPLDQSSGKVVVYHGNGQADEILAPTSGAGTNTVWHVFNLVINGSQQTYQKVNQFKAAAP